MLIALLDKLKIQNRGLLLLLITTLLLSGVIPLINYYFILPRYDQAIINRTEIDAIRIAKHISRMMTDEGKAFTVEAITQWADREMLKTSNEFGLHKIMVCNAEGTVLFSTSSTDIGTLNTHDYFSNVVAKGKNFSKVVRQNQKDLEGNTAPLDIVETSVPIMNNSEFIGAFEIYYDITNVLGTLRETFLFSMLLFLPIMVLFLMIIVVTILSLERKNREDKKNKQLLEEQKKALLAEQKKENALFKFVENAKRQWETTMDCLSELIFLTDLDFVIRRCNSAVVEFTGSSYQQLAGRNVKEILPDTSLEAGDTTIGGSREYFHKSSRQWFLLSLFPVVETVGQEPGFVISMSDITVIKRMTAKLEQTNQETSANRNSLQQALDYISQLIGEAIEGGSYHSTSLNKERTCWKVKECDQESCPCYGEDGMRCWQKSGTFCGGEVQGKFAQKFSSCVECDFFKSVTPDPATLISEQFNNLMFMLANKKRELEEAYAQLKQTQAQFLQQEKMASIGQLAAGVAHEINNPVGFISSNLGSLGKYIERLRWYISFLEGSLERIDNAEVQASVAAEKMKLKLDFILQDINDLVTESLDGCERVAKIVQDLKSFSRVDQAEKQYADLNECIEITLNMVTNELKYKAKVEKEYGPVAAIECHPQQLNQVFMNILINAGHAIEKEGVIAIKTWQDKEFVYCAISDNGAGIKPENLNRIFEPFYTTKDVGKGTGLGLSIVYDIITKNHKGNIDVTSEVGRGTTFTIKLPRGSESV